MSFLRLPLWATLFGAFAIAGCDSGASATVKQSCETQRAWVATDQGRCASCKSAAILPKCDCEAFKDFGAACASEGEAKTNEVSCTKAIDDCVRACAGDCDCVDGCYANAPDCKAAAADVAACVTDVCAPYCDDAQ